MRSKHWKRLFIGLVLVTIAAGCAMVGFTSTLEQPNYKVIDTLPGGIEIRQYESRTFASSRVDGTGMESRRQGFRLLFNYITGENSSEEEISMTIPVATEIKDKEHVMQFFLPSEYDAASAPAPKNPNVSIGTIAPRVEAALEYTGSQSVQRAEMHAFLMKNALNDSNWQSKGDIRSMFYNPPFSIPFLRRNEVIVEVTPK
jgi:hypothetical protein